MSDSQFTCDRRAALRLGAGAAIGLALSPAAASAMTEPPASPTSPEPLFTMSLAEWSFHRALLAQKMDHLDFAPTAADRYGIKAVEYVNQFFKDKAEDAVYLKRMKTVAADAGVKSLLIMIDGEGALGDPDEAARTKAVENHYKWVEAAKYLGCHSIRVNAHSDGTYDEQLALAADGLRRLTEFGARHDLNVIVENHGGLSSNGTWLAAVMRRVDHPRCGTLPDFGNFRIAEGQEYDRYKGVAQMMPFAKAVSAKSHVFDDKGNEAQIDYFRMVKIVVDHGYHGHLGIEYEGDGLSEHEGVLATKRLLERVREKLSRAETSKP